MDENFLTRKFPELRYLKSGQLKSCMCVNRALYYNRRTDHLRQISNHFQELNTHSPEAPSSLLCKLPSLLHTQFSQAHCDNYIIIIMVLHCTQPLASWSFCHIMYFILWKSAPLANTISNNTVYCHMWVDVYSEQTRKGISKPQQSDR